MGEYSSQSSKTRTSAIAMVMYLERCHMYLTIISNVSFVELEALELCALQVRRTRGKHDDGLARDLMRSLLVPRSRQPNSFDNDRHVLIACYCSSTPLFPPCKMSIPTRKKYPIDEAMLYCEGSSLLLSG